MIKAIENFIRRQIDFASALTLLVTIALFAIAIVEKGLTHDLLLEAGVFLVSVKLVLSTFKMQEKLRTLEAKLDQLLNRP
jgi:hypothetical protein